LVKSKAGSLLTLQPGGIPYVSRPGTGESPARHQVQRPPDGRNPASATAMKVLSSLNSAKRRHADCQVVKRKGTLYVICKSNPKFKARQGATPGTRMSKKGVK